MITQQQARKYLEPGDVVYLARGGGIARAWIRKVGTQFLDTDRGILEYEDHGYTWWLTKRVAREEIIGHNRRAEDGK